MSHIRKWKPSGGPEFPFGALYCFAMSAHSRRLASLTRFEREFEATPATILAVNEDGTLKVRARMMPHLANDVVSVRVGAAPARLQPPYQDSGFRAMRLHKDKIDMDSAYRSGGMMAAKWRSSRRKKVRPAREKPRM